MAKKRSIWVPFYSFLVTYKKFFYLFLFLLLLVFLGYVFFGPVPFYENGVKNLESLQKYAASNQEFVPMDNSDVVKPIFESTYKKKFNDTFFSRGRDRAFRLLNFLKLAAPPVFSFGQLDFLLQKVTQQQNGLNRKALHVRKIFIRKDSKLVVFGVLHAAYHSLVRDLTQLKQLGFIGENFKILKPETYIFFLGNATGRATYSIEVLTVILKLMEQNPDNVIFMRGSFEFNDTWIQHSLRQELELAGKPYSTEKIPLETKVNKFFETLPVETYGVISHKKNDKEVPYIVLSAYIEAKDLQKIVRERQNYPEFIGNSDQLLELSTVKIKEKEKTVDAKPRPSLKATVRDIRKRRDFEKLDGMRRLPPDGDITQWTMLSCPTVLIRKALKFEHDAFVVINAADAYKDWEIILYNRHVDSKSMNFESRKEPFFDLASIAKDAETQKADIKSEASARKEESKSKSDTDKNKKEISKSQKAKKTESESTSSKQKNKSDEVPTPAEKNVERKLKISRADDQVDEDSNIEVSEETRSFYKNIVQQVEALKKEISDVRNSILKELQKFELADQNPKNSPDVSKKPSQNILSNASQSKIIEGKKVFEKNVKLEDAVSNLLKELQEQKRAGVTIYNSLGNDAVDSGISSKEKSKDVQHQQSAGFEKKSIDGLVAAIETLKKELHQQRDLTKKILEEQGE